MDASPQIIKANKTKDMNMKQTDFYAQTGQIDAQIPVVDWDPGANRAITWTASEDASLRRLVAQGRPLLLVGRAAGVSPRSRRDAAESVWQAADSLAKVGGMDVREVLPSREWLATSLAQPGAEQRTANSHGSSSRSRSLVVDLSQHGVILLVTAGTDDFHVRLLTHCVRNVTPRVAGLFASRPDRITRGTFGAAGLLQELRFLDREVHAWAGDGVMGAWRLNQPHFPLTMAMYLQAGESEAFARKAQHSRGHHE